MKRLKAEMDRYYNRDECLLDVEHERDINHEKKVHRSIMLQPELGKESQVLSYEFFGDTWEIRVFESMLEYYQFIKPADWIIFQTNFHFGMFNAVSKVTDSNIEYVTEEMVGEKFRFSEGACARVGTLELIDGAYLHFENCINEVVSSAGETEESYEVKLESLSMLELIK